MKALTLIPKRLDTAVAAVFGRRLVPILAVLLEKGEEKQAKQVAIELMQGGGRGKIVTLHTEAQYEAVSRKLEAEPI